MLKNVFLDLASESSTAWGDPRLAPLADKLKLIDGSLLKNREGNPIFLVKVEANGKELLIVADLEIETESISLIDRYRWQIELFFKWLKCILKCRHLLAESEQGVTIQIYAALIAALMLQVLTGKRPTKRKWKSSKFHLMDYIDLDELMTVL